jgi:hypothetical protein
LPITAILGAWMNRKETLQAATAMALVMGLVGCGDSGSNPISTFGGPLGRVGNTGATGGSGSNLGASNSGGAYDLQTAIANMVSRGLSATVSLSGTLVVVSGGTQTGISGSGLYTLTAGVSTTFNNTSAVSQNQTFSGTAVANGQTVPVAGNITNFYTTASNGSEFLGLVANDGDMEYDVAQTPFQFPTSITGATTGTLGTLLRYQDSTMSVSLGNVQVTYTTTAPTTTGGPISVTITMNSYDTTTTLVETDTTTYSMTSDNVLSLVSSTTQNSSGTIILTAN